MFKKSRKDKLVDRAQHLAHDVSDAAVAQAKKAREEIAPHLENARKEVAPRVAEARDQLREQFDKEVAPRLEDARDRVAAGAKQAYADAREQASTYAAEAERRGSLATSALKGEEVKRPSKKRKLLVLAALVGAGVLVARKLAGGQQDNWQSSYTPSPAPTPPPAPAPTGAAPGESLADAREEPHPVTTPDDPAETVDLNKSADGTDASAAADAEDPKR